MQTQLDLFTKKPPRMRQVDMVRSIMADGEWRTLPDIQEMLEEWFNVHAMETSISARLRDLRRYKHGSHVVDRRVRKSPGLFEYKLSAEGS